MNIANFGRPLPLHSETSEKEASLERGRVRGRGGRERLGIMFSPPSAKITALTNAFRMLSSWQALGIPITCKFQTG